MRGRGYYIHQKGNIVPLVVSSVFVMIGILAFSVDGAIAYTAKVKQENALDGSRNSCMSCSHALVLKNSDHPGRDIARTVGGSLRDDGFEGEIVVWFYEMREGELPASRRLWVIGVQIEEGSPTVFAQSLGIESIPVASNEVMIAEPFSDTRAWRPEDSGNGRYVVADHESIDALGYERLDDLARYPAEMVDRVLAAEENTMIESLSEEGRTA